MKRREEQIGECRLILGDCLEIMPTLGSIDHVITDPPYEEHTHRRGGRVIRTDKGPELTAIPFDPVTDIRAAAARVICAASKGWALIFSTPEGVALWRDEIEAAGAKYKRACVWVKPDSAPQFNGQGPAAGAENIVSVWCGSGHSHWNGGGRRGVFTYPVNPTNRNGQHPTEKPILLMKELVYLFSNLQETILDPFMGSGTTGIACVQLDRQFIGIELDAKYFDLACRRIERATRESGDIFIPDRQRLKFKDFFGDPKAAAQAVEKTDE